MEIGAEPDPREDPMVRTADSQAARAHQIPQELLHVQSSTA